MKHVDWIIVLAMLAIGSSIIAIVLTLAASLGGRGDLIIRAVCNRRRGAGTGR
jgi:hypothetical protein